MSLEGNMLSQALTILCETPLWARLRTHLIVPVAAALVAHSACGGGSGDGVEAPVPSLGCSDTSCGTLLVGLTDADGDFLSYSVDVVSLSLETASGRTVEALPVRQRVDFAELVDLTELVTAATIPNGTYISASITLDYADAEVTVELTGEPVEATVVDAGGAPLGVTTLDIALDDANHVIIAPGLPSLLQLDFDLAASHRVDITTDPVTAFAAPFIVATIQPVDDKELRVRGPLVSVNVNASNYVIDLRPFNQPSGFCRVLSLRSPCHWREICCLRL
jgi:hypothetical protein